MLPSTTENEMVTTGVLAAPSVFCRVRLLIPAPFAASGPLKSLASPKAFAAPWTLCSAHDIRVLPRPFGIGRRTYLNSTAPTPVAQSLF
jgi:hypothetical protein